jgi:hypothetical protein
MDESYNLAESLHGAYEILCVYMTIQDRHSFTLLWVRSRCSWPPLGQ